jgi:methionyl-tRNA formyltransferase
VLTKSSLQFLFIYILSYFFDESQNESCSAPVHGYVKITVMGINVVFMGTPDFALPTLAALVEKFYVTGVVTQPDRPAGRGRMMQPPAVKTLASKLGLPILQPPSLKDQLVIESIKKMLPDVIVVAAFGQILKADILSFPPYGCINVHASLLPRWRGAAPIQAAILNDDTTGVSIMKMDQGLDTGPILSQRRVSISNAMTAGELTAILAQMGADLLVETLPLYIEGDLIPRPQDDALATYAPRLTPSTGELDFGQPAAFLARKVRAYNPWPGAYQYFEGIRLKVFQAHAAVGKDAVPGKRYVIDQKPAWGTADGFLVLDEVQAAGKGRLSGADFIRGTREWVHN